MYVRLLKVNMQGIKFICMCVCFIGEYAWIKFICIREYVYGVTARIEFYMYVRVFIGEYAWIKFICIREYV